MADVGYISEAGASVVDRFFGLFIVPRTEVIELGAASLNYPIWTRWEANRRLKDPTRSKDQSAFPEKIGSLQLYVGGYRSAKDVLGEISAMSVCPKSLIVAVQKEFEKLVVLDWVIRNTDRGLDNFLMRLDWREEIDEGGEEMGFAYGPLEVKGAPRKLLIPTVKLAAIDNGLAFPYKHPDNWRGYPYGWAQLAPFVNIPFSGALRASLLPILRDVEAWDVLEEELRVLFKIDSAFTEGHFQRQMGVVRGQLGVLWRILEVDGSTPADLIRQKPVVIMDEEDYFKESRRHPSYPPGQHSQEYSTEGHPRWTREVPETSCCPCW